jgi:hypothetical protein
LKISSDSTLLNVFSTQTNRIVFVKIVDRRLSKNYQVTRG